MKTPAPKIAGVKQSKRAIEAGMAQLVFLAYDADPAVTEPLEALCQSCSVPVNFDHSLAELGRACGLAVGAAVAVSLK